MPKPTNFLLHLILHLLLLHARLILQKRLQHIGNFTKKRPQQTRIFRISRLLNKVLLNMLSILMNIIVRRLKIVLKESI